MCLSTILLACAFLQGLHLVFLLHLLMESFKDVLIRDKQGTFHQQKHTLLSEVGEKNLSIHKIEGNQEGSSDEQIPNTDHEELPECDKFNSLYLTGKMLGDSIPVKTTTAKSNLIGCLKGK